MAANYFDAVVSVDDELVAREFSLMQNYPNPFNPATNIEYSVPSNEFVSLKVYDMLGREVATLVDEIQKAGNYKITFDGKFLSSGVYIYKLQSKSFNQSRTFLH